MEPDRSDILKDHLKVHPDEVQWYFKANYYSGPISGLAFFRGRLYRFCCFPEDIPDQNIKVLHELTEEELAKELKDKAKFEECVGTHWSYDIHGKKLPRVKPHPDLTEQYYKEQILERDPDPRDRPIVAWFDARDRH